MLVKIASSFIPSREARRRFRHLHDAPKISDYGGLFGVTVPASGDAGPSPVESGGGTDVSVVIPVYNVRNYLSDCLDSVLASARRLLESDAAASVEVICVDDGSTDSSGNVLDEYESKNSGMPRLAFSVIHQANAGVSAARNRGMDAASGKVIAFLDADDTFVPDALPLIWRTACGEGADLIRYEWNLVRNHRDDVLSVAPNVRMERFMMNATLSPLHQAKCGAFVVISRALADKLRWPAVSHGEDPLFLLDCLHESRKSVAIRAPLANYLVRPDSASHASPLTAFVRTMSFAGLAIDKMAAWREWPGIREDTCDWICHTMFDVCFCGWRKMPRRDRLLAREAYWRGLSSLAERDDLFSERLRRRCLKAAQSQSTLLLLLTVVFPCRWRKDFRAHA